MSLHLSPLRSLGRVMYYFSFDERTEYWRIKCDWLFANWVGWDKTIYIVVTR